MQACYPSSECSKGEKGARRGAYARVFTLFCNGASPSVGNVTPGDIFGLEEGEKG